MSLWLLFLSLFSLNAVVFSTEQETNLRVLLVPASPQILDGVHLRSLLLLTFKGNFIQSGYNAIMKLVNDYNVIYDVWFPHSPSLTKIPVCADGFQHTLLHW